MTRIGAGGACCPTARTFPDTSCTMDGGVFMLAQDTNGTWRILGKRGDREVWINMIRGTRAQCGWASRQSAEKNFAKVKDAYSRQGDFCETCNHRPCQCEEE